MAASPPTWKAHDTYPPLQAFLQQAGGASVLALTTASQVKLIMKGTTGTSPALVTGVMSIASAAQGYVTYSWAVGDLVQPNTYNVEFEIAWTAGGIETVPNDVYDQLIVVQDLENA